MNSSKVILMHEAALDVDMNSSREIYGVIACVASRIFRIVAAFCW